MVRVKPIPFCSQYRASSSSVEEIPQHQEHMGSPMYLSVTSPPGACFAPGDGSSVGNPATAGGRIAVHECHGWSPQVEAVWRSAAAIAPPAQCRPANRSSRGPEQFGISLLVEQRIQLPRVAEFDPEEPAGAQRVGVGKRRGVAQGRVDGDDFAGDGVYRFVTALSDSISAAAAPAPTSRRRWAGSPKSGCPGRPAPVG